MKRLTVLLLCLALVLLAAGCSAEKVDRYVADLGEKVIDVTQTYMDKREEAKAAEAAALAEQEAAEAAGKADAMPVVEEGIERTEEAVVLTLDQRGIAQIHTFVYNSGKLASGSVYMDCLEAARVYAARAYFENANAEQVVFENIKTVDTVITANYTADGLREYSGCTMDELCTLLADRYDLPLPVAETE